MAVSDIIPFGQKPELHTLKLLPARCRDYRTQGRAQSCLGSKRSDEEVDDVFSRRPLYCGRAGSDVIGCRRPTGGVLYMYASDTGHADGVPHSDP